MHTYVQFIKPLSTPATFNPLTKYNFKSRISIILTENYKKHFNHEVTI